MGNLKTNSEFTSEIDHLKLVALDEYVSAKTKIRFGCIECGNIWSARPDNILHGKGCPGCKSIATSKRSRRTNAIIADHGTWIEIDVSTRKHTNAVMLIDRADFDSLNSSGIGGVTATHDGNTLYAATTFDGKLIKIHRLLFAGAERVDHRDHNGLNNRQSNLRPCTASQNSMNSVRPINNTSGIKGVGFDKRRSKWRAFITYRKTSVHLGYFDKKEDAIMARADAEKKYHGEFAYKPVIEAVRNSMPDLLTNERLMERAG